MKKTPIIPISLGMLLVSFSMQAQQAPKEATSATITFNKESTAAFNWADTQDFENAKKGFIAPLENGGKIMVKDGKTVALDMSKFDFIKEGVAAPSTVNPSLWRQTQVMLAGGPGLFEVVEGVYQVRNADIANMTIVEGKKGVTIYDPLTSEEAAKAALDLYYKHRGVKPVVAVLYSHSHVDHVAGVRGVVNEQDVKSGKVKIYAPAGFLNEYIAENVFAGTAMSRRASYQYGFLSAPGPKGTISTGLGVGTSSGTVTLIPPTHIISQTGQKEVIDGIEYEFVMAPGSEAPAEMMWYMPKFKMVATAEDATHTQHNLYTLRGAKNRDAEKWPRYLSEVIQKWAGEYQVQIGMHHWPVWGQEEITKLIKAQRDTYKFIHDQTLHYANMGYTINEMPEMVKLPKSLVDQWATHGYYGTTSHNSRAVYNYYLGYYDGNPANLNPLTPEDESKRYIELIGADKAFQEGKKAFNKGDYRWAATILNKLVFAQANNQEAKNLLADVYDQLAYQSEAGTWRGWYLTAATELRNGVVKMNTAQTSSPDSIANMSLDLIFAYMGIQLDAAKVDGKEMVFNFIFPDMPKAEQNHTLFLENSVLNHWAGSQVDNADATLTLNRSTLNKILSKQMTFEKAIAQGDVKVSGDTAKFKDLASSLTDLNQYFWFNMVTP